MANSSPPHPGAQVGLAQVATHEQRDASQELVPDVVPQRVVDGLEVVDVEQTERERQSVAPAARELA